MHKKGFLLIVALMVLLGGALSLTPALAAGLTYQAEDATRGGGVNYVTTGTGFFGTGYVNFPASGGWVEFRNVDGEAGGGMLLRFRYKLSSTVSNVGRLTVNGANQSITFSPTGSGPFWAIKEVVVTLTPGTSNTIRLASTGQYLANLDQLTVTPSYQAEDQLLGGGVNVVTTGTGFFGTGYVNFPASGGWVEFPNVDGGAGGSKLLRFRYKLGSTVSNTGRLTVNGTSQNITFRSTGSWTTWAVHSVTVNLNSGTSNTIRLASTGQYLANLDQLEIQAIDVPCSPATTITVPYVFSGQGTYCWVTNDPGDSINSWNLSRLTINGVDITNRWVGSSSYPPAINGFWYIDYTGDYPWSHIEVR